MGQPHSRPHRQRNTRRPARAGRRRSLSVFWWHRLQPVLLALVVAGLQTRELRQAAYNALIRSRVLLKAAWNAMGTTRTTSKISFLAEKLELPTENHSG